MRVLIFGANGSIGADLVSRFTSENHEVFSVIRKKSDSSRDITADVLNNDMQTLIKHRKYDSIIFAQGTNFNDSILDTKEEKHLEMYSINCLFIIKAMNFLVENDLLQQKANIVIISSIWQEIIRHNKLSYSITKAAIAGLVRSLSIDLAKYGNNKKCMVNAVLPGAILTPMTLQNLSEEQISILKKNTPGGNLVTLENIFETTKFLTSVEGVTGQFINVDYGFSYSKIF